MSDSSQLEFMASTISEVLSLPTDQLFGQGTVPPNYEFTTQMEGNLNHILRKVLFPIKVPYSGTPAGQDSDPVILPELNPSQENAVFELASSEFNDNYKSTWDVNQTRLMDQKTTADNDNSQSASFSSTMILLLAILFKKEVIQLPAEAGHDELKVTDLLAPGTEVIDGAVKNWLTSSTADGSFCKETFTAQQFKEIYDTLAFQNRYKVFAHPVPAQPVTVLTNPIFMETVSGVTTTYHVNPSTHELYRGQGYSSPHAMMTFRRAVTDDAPPSGQGATFGGLTEPITESPLDWGFNVDSSARSADDLKDLTTITKVGFFLDDAVKIVDIAPAARKLYSLRYYTVNDRDGQPVIISQNMVNSLGNGWASEDSKAAHDAKLVFGASPSSRPFGSLSAETDRLYCLEPMAIGYLKDVKGVQFDWKWFGQKPGPGIDCRYGDAAPTQLFRLFEEPVYTNSAGTRYIGTPIQGFIIDNAFLQKVNAGIWGCPVDTFDVAEGWKECSKEEDLFHYSTAGTLGGTNYHNESDVYRFGASAKFLREAMVPVKYIVDGVNELGYRQGTWRAAVADGEDERTGTPYPPENILGGQIDLKENDAIGIVVDISSDSVGLNKVLPIRLLITHKIPVVP